MKHLKLAAGLLVLSITFACIKVDEVTQFTMVYSENVVIQSNTMMDLPFNAFTTEISSNSETTFEKIPISIIDKFKGTPM